MHNIEYANIILQKKKNVRNFALQKFLTIFCQNVSVSVCSLFENVLLINNIISYEQSGPSLVLIFGPRIIQVQ